MGVPVILGDAAAAGIEAPGARQPKTVAEAARQFEALLVSQILKAAHGEEGWLGSGEDASDATAAGLAEEQFAQALAQNGGLGLSARIVASLSRAGQ